MGSQLGDAVLELVHPAPYIAFLEELSEAGGGAIDADTYAVPGTFGAALRSCGGAVALVDALLGGEADVGVSAIRPAGHHAEVARATEERTLGLGGRDSMPRDAGMLFTDGSVRTVTPWMRGMRFPLDFIWIAEDNTVIGTEELVPSPEPGTPDSDLATYPSPEPVLYFLEVNAGVAEQYGITAGDAVDFEPEP